MKKKNRTYEHCLFLNRSKRPLPLPVAFGPVDTDSLSSGRLVYTLWCELWSPLPSFIWKLLNWSLVAMVHVNQSQWPCPVSLPCASSKVNSRAKKTEKKLWSSISSNFIFYFRRYLFENGRIGTACHRLAFVFDATFLIESISDNDWWLPSFVDTFWYDTVYVYITS